LRILSVEDGKKRKGIIGVPEFEQLAGNLDNLCVFATKTVTEPSSVIKSGKRSQFSKYLLFPVALRRKFKTTDFDFEKLVCGVVEYKDALYVVYGVGRKAPSAE